MKVNNRAAMLALRSQRRAIALAFVAIFSLNGLLAVATVAAHVHAPAVVAAHSIAPAAPEPACSCTCCGDRCTMGAACCCPKSGPAPEASPTIRFAPLGCAPGDAVVPLMNFLAFRYLPPATAVPPFPAAAFAAFDGAGRFARSLAPKPAAPLPRTLS